jgi:hypothetical protein
MTGAWSRRIAIRKYFNRTMTTTGETDKANDGI